MLKTLLSSIILAFIPCTVLANSIHYFDTGWKPATEIDEDNISSPFLVPKAENSCQQVKITATVTYAITAKMSNNLSIPAVFSGSISTIHWIGHKKLPEPQFFAPQNGTGFWPPWGLAANDGQPGGLDEYTYTYMVTTDIVPQIVNDTSLFKFARDRGHVLWYTPKFYYHIDSVNHLPWEDGSHYPLKIDVEEALARVTGFIEYID